MKQKKPRVTIKEKVFSFLKNKNVAISRDSIASQCNLKQSSVKWALKSLRKEKKIGCLKVYARCFPSFIEKSYWGAY